MAAVYSQTPSDLNRIEAGMGLESVYLVMAFEEEFEVEIPDDDAERIVTVGDARDFIVSKLRERAEDPGAVDPEEVLSRIKAIIIDLIGVRPEKVTPEAAFIDDLGVD